MDPTAAETAAEQYRTHLERLERLLLLALTRADRAVAVAPALEGAVAHHTLRAALWRSRCQAGAILGRTLGEMALQQLLIHEGWSHPSQVLDPPRPSLSEVLRACRDFGQSLNGLSERRSAVEARIARLAAIEETASRRRTVARLGAWLGEPSAHEGESR